MRSFIIAKPHSRANIVLILSGIIVMKKAFLLTALALAFGSAASAADAAPPAAAPPAPVSADPQDTSATYGTWTLRCQRSAPGAPTARVCAVIQAIQFQGQQGVVAQIIVARASAKDPMHINIILPVNISFPSKVRAMIDEKDTQPVELAWQRCLPNGCIAETELKEDVLKRWKAQSDAGRLEFTDAQGRDLAMPFSFKGFAQALDGFAKSGS
jgi:invasion protein IalB